MPRYSNTQPLLNMLNTKTKGHHRASPMMAFCGLRPALDLWRGFKYGSECQVQMGQYPTFSPIKSKTSFTGQAQTYSGKAVAVDDRFLGRRVITAGESSAPAGV